MTLLILLAIAVAVIVFAATRKEPVLRLLEGSSQHRS